MVETVQPFLESQGYELTTFKIPFWIICPPIIIFQLLAILMSPIYKIYSVVDYKIASNLYNSHWFNYTRATECLGYQPLYSSEEAVAM